jgi:hypothetical protein
MIIFELDQFLNLNSKERKVNLHKHNLDLRYFSDCVKFFGEIIKNEDAINVCFDSNTGHFVVNFKDDSGSGYTGKSFLELMCSFISKKLPPEHFSNYDADFLVCLEDFLKENNRIRILADSNNFSIWVTDPEGVGSQVRHFDLLLGLHKAIKFEKEAVSL